MDLYYMSLKYKIRIVSTYELQLVFETGLLTNYIMWIVNIFLNYIFRTVLKQESEEPGQFVDVF